ncbi:MAG: LytTR family DNA-binding domain-containing protein [Evtepia sp.]
MYKVAVCDDDDIFNDSFQALVKEFLSIHSISYQLDFFTTIEGFAKAMAYNGPYDLVFLDILLGNDNGLDFARSMRASGQQTDIVLISVHPDYAIAAYEVAPLHYLMKPIQPEQLELALRRSLAKCIPHKLVFQTSNGLLAATPDEILYIEIYDRTIFIHKTDGTRDALTGTISELEKNLPPFRFVRCHRSYLVNMTHIDTLIRYEISLYNGIKIPISKNRYRKVQNAYIEYAQQKSPVFL